MTFDRYFIEFDLTMALLRLITSCTRGKSIDITLSGIKSLSRIKKELDIRGFHQKIFCRESTKNSQRLQWLFASSGVVLTKLVFDFKTAKCEAQPPKLVIVNDNEIRNQSEVSFPWIQFLQYLWPHVGNLKNFQFILL